MFSHALWMLGALPPHLLSRVNTEASISYGATLSLGADWWKHLGQQLAQITVVLQGP